MAAAQWPPEWQVTVRAFEGERTVKVGVQDGRVVVEAPPLGTFSMDPDAADILHAAFKAAANRARLQRQAGRR